MQLLFPRSRFLFIYIRHSKTRQRRFFLLDPKQTSLSSAIFSANCRKETRAPGNLWYLEMNGLSYFQKPGFSPGSGGEEGPDGSSADMLLCAPSAPTFDRPWTALALGTKKAATASDCFTDNNRPASHAGISFPSIHA